MISARQRTPESSSRRTKPWRKYCGTTPHSAWYVYITIFFCSLRWRASVMQSELRNRKISRAAAFWTTCSLWIKYSLQACGLTSLCAIAGDRETINGDDEKKTGPWTRRRKLRSRWITTLSRLNRLNCPGHEPRKLALLHACSRTSHDDSTVDADVSLLCSISTPSCPLSSVTYWSWQYCPHIQKLSMKNE